MISELLSKNEDYTSHLLPNYFHPLKWQLLSTHTLRYF